MSQLWDCETIGIPTDFFYPMKHTQNKVGQQVIGKQSKLTNMERQNNKHRCWRWIFSRSRYTYTVLECHQIGRFITVGRCCSLVSLKYQNGRRKLVYTLEMSQWYLFSHSTLGSSTILTKFAIRLLIFQQQRNNYKRHHNFHQLVCHQHRQDQHDIDLIRTLQTANSDINVFRRYSYITRQCASLVARGYTRECIRNMKGLQQAQAGASR